MSGHNFIQRLWFGEALFPQAFWLPGLVILFTPVLMGFVVMMAPNAPAGNIHGVLAIVLCWAWLVMVWRNRMHARWKWSAWVAILLVVMFMVAMIQVTVREWNKPHDVAESTQEVAQ